MTRSSQLGIVVKWTQAWHNYESTSNEKYHLSKHVRNRVQYVTFDAINNTVTDNEVYLIEHNETSKKTNV